MTANEILNILNADEDFAFGCNFYGIRADRPGIEVGEHFANSHQWWQDDPSDWGEECEYNEERGFWDGGELPGTCSIGLGDFPTVESIAEAIERARGYIYGNSTNLYLIRGNGCEGGNDIGESIIYNAEMVAEI